MQDRAAALDQQAAENQVNATPTLFVGKRGTPGEQVSLTSPTDERALVQAIDAALGA